MSTTDVEAALKTLRRHRIAAVVIGASAGGLDAIATLLAALDAPAPFAIVCILHLRPGGESMVADVFARRSGLAVKEAESTERLEPGQIYVAPADYHLSIEPDRSFALSVDDPVLFSRPSIGVLFESAAEAYGPELLGVLLTGANSDGAAGLARIRECGGLTAVQDPGTAEFADMPRAALSLLSPDFVMALPQLVTLLRGLTDGAQ